jgi:hypothetical protein
MNQQDKLAFANALLPGDDLFPRASETGILRTLDRLPAGLAQALGPIAALEPDARVARMEQLQAENPALFAEAQKTVYLAYYEQPEVIAAIRAMGIPYHSVLLPEGYDIAPFDPLIDTPRHRRGAWVATENVRPLDLAPLTRQET